MGYPVFVLAIRPDTNEIVVGTGEESLTRYVRAGQINFMSVEDLPEQKTGLGKNPLQSQRGLVYGGKDRGR